MRSFFPAAGVWGFALLVVLALAALFASAVLAQEATPPAPAGGVTDDQVNAIAKQLYCPVCENIPLDVCPTQACAQWRALIREKLAAGWTEPQIKEYFVQQYGDRVLATPPARGLNWLVYLLPPIAIVAGVFILYRALLAWKAPPTVAPYSVAPPASVDQSSLTQAPADEYAARLEEELRRR
jgi:cytochrome c-type biogenesis protein CcmH